MKTYWQNPGSGGRVKVEARAAGAHNLDATDADIQSNKVFIAVSARAEWLAKQITIQ